jgi:hypothetical protein
VSVVVASGVGAWNVDAAGCVVDGAGAGVLLHPLAENANPTTDKIAIKCGDFIVPILGVGSQTVATGDGRSYLRG